MVLYSVPVLYADIPNSFLLGPLGSVLAWGVLSPFALFPFTLRSCCCWVFPIFLLNVGVSLFPLFVDLGLVGVRFSGFSGVLIPSSSRFLFRCFLGTSL